MFLTYQLVLQLHLSLSSECLRVEKEAALCLFFLTLPFVRLKHDQSLEESVNVNIGHICGRKIKPGNKCLSFNWRLVYDFTFVNIRKNFKCFHWENEGRRGSNSPAVTFWFLCTLMCHFSIDWNWLERIKFSFFFLISPYKL